MCLNLGTYFFRVLSLTYPNLLGKKRLCCCCCCCCCLLSLGWLLLMLLSKCLTFFWYSFTLVKETPPSVTLDEWHCSLRRWIYISGLCCVTMQSFMFDRKGSWTLAYGSLVCCSFCSWDLRQKSLLVGWPKSWLGETWKHAPYGFMFCAVFKLVLREYLRMHALHLGLSLP